MSILGSSSWTTRPSPPPSDYLTASPTPRFGPSALGFRVSIDSGRLSTHDYGLGHLRPGTNDQPAGSRASGAVTEVRRPGRYGVQRVLALAATPRLRAWAYVPPSRTWDPCRRDDAMV